MVGLFHFFTSGTIRVTTTGVVKDMYTCACCTKAQEWGILVIIMKIRRNFRIKWRIVRT